MQNIGRHLRNGQLKFEFKQLRFEFIPRFQDSTIKTKIEIFLFKDFWSKLFLYLMAPLPSENRPFGVEKRINLRI